MNQQKHLSGLKKEGNLSAEMEKLGIYIAPGSKLMVPDLNIGIYTRINGPISIVGHAPCTIGMYCAFGDAIHIITSNHDMRYPNIQLNFNRRLGLQDLIDIPGNMNIGNNVWIGDCAILLPGITIGDGAVIGAGSIITGDVAPFTIVAGSPGRKIRKRFSQNIIDQLLFYRWWEWDPERIDRNKTFFSTDLTKDPDLDLSSLILD